MLIGESLNKLGLKVTIIENAKKIFKDYEDEISNILSEGVKASGIDILTESKIVSVNSKPSENAYSVSVVNAAGDIKNSNEIETDLVVLAAGITANTDFLSHTSIELGTNMAIKVTNKQQTSYPNIYAAGDCCLVKNLITQKNEFIPTAGNAIKTGRIAGSNAAGGDESFKGSLGTKVDKIFDLEIAKTGIGYKEASETGFDVLKLTDSYSSFVKALPGVSNITITITVDKKTGKLLGSQMIGKEGIGKRIDIFAAAISNEMKVNDIYMLDLSYAPKISTAIDPVNSICGKAMLELQKLY